MSNTRLIAELIGNLEGSSSARRTVDFMDTGEVEEAPVSRKEGAHEIVQNDLYTTVFDAVVSDQQAMLPQIEGVAEAA